MFSLRPTSRYIQFLPVDCNHNHSDPQRESPSQVRRLREQQDTLPDGLKTCENMVLVVLYSKFHLMLLCFFLLPYTDNFSIDKK